MSEKDLEKKNPCGEDSEIDEYLGGTICEVIPDLNDIDAPGDAEFEVDSPEEVEEDNRYEGQL